MPLFGEPLNGTNSAPMFAVAFDMVVNVVAARIENEAIREEVRVGEDVRARLGRPVAAVRTGIAKRSRVAVTGAGEENAIR